jgi:hypothetical protein
MYIIIILFLLILSYPNKFYMYYFVMIGRY